MNHRETIERELSELSDLARVVQGAMLSDVESIAESVRDTLAGGGRLFFCGNGGSAADAQHLAAEYVVRFGQDRRALPALAFTTDTSILTACGNDLGFQEIFARQVEALARPEDLLFLHSTSGESENMIRAAQAARAGGVPTVGFLAKGGGRLAGLVDRPLVVPTNSTARAQEIHLALGHIICGIVERTLFAEGGGVP